jgi:hypothetical protein
MTDVLKNLFCLFLDTHICKYPYFMASIRNSEKRFLLRQGNHASSLASRAVSVDVLPQSGGGQSWLRLHFLLDFLDRRQASFEFFGQRLDNLRFPLGHANGLLDIAKRICYNNFILGST